MEDREQSPFVNPEPRPHAGSHFDREEVRLANRNHGLALELMRHDITPIGMHYLLTHFDVPHLSEDSFQLIIGGEVSKPLTLSLGDLKSRPTRTVPVTLECAGNGRAGHDRRRLSMPWHHEAVGTSEWTGTPLIDVLEEAGLTDKAVEIAFLGADRGFDDAVEHNFGRSLTLAQVKNPDILLVHTMNGQPLLPQHGAPLRLIVPGWYGMASVKWLTHIDVLDHNYDGFQQVRTYRYRETSDDPGVGITHLRVKSLMIPPGLPDWYSRQRLVEAGNTEIAGRAWSGNGVPIEQVEFSDDGENWTIAKLSKKANKYAWAGWTCEWQAKPGEYQLMCRATDANGTIQPLTPPWDESGFGNNAVQRVQVTVR